MPPFSLRRRGATPIVGTLGVSTLMALAFATAPSRLVAQSAAPPSVPSAAVAISLSAGASQFDLSGTGWRRKALFE